MAVDDDSIMVGHKQSFSSGAPGILGNDVFTYKLSDGVDDSEAQVTIQITNSIPVASDDYDSIDFDTPLSAGVLGNDDDDDGDALTAVIVDSPANGSVTLNSDGSFTYTPVSTFFGSDSFTYQADDGFDTGNIATVSIQVKAPAISISATTSLAKEVGLVPGQLT